MAELQQPLGAPAPGQGPSSAHQQQAAAELRKEPQPPADAHRYLNKVWSPPKPLTDRSLAHPPQVVFTKNTLKSLFGWQHGSSREYCPTVVFRCTPRGGGAAVEVEPVQLLPPSRDDRDVASKKLEGGTRGRVDGYPVPTAVVKQLLAQLFGGTSPAGRRLHFRSAGWRGTQLVLDASHGVADTDEAAGAASDREAHEGEASQPAPQRSVGGARQRSAGGGTQSQAQPQPQASPAAACAAAAAALPEAGIGVQQQQQQQQQQQDQAAVPAGAAQQQGLAGAAAAAGGPAVPAASAAAAGRQQTEDFVDLVDDDSPPFLSPQATTPAEVFVKEVFVKQEEKQQAFSALGGLAAAAAEASAAAASADGGKAERPQPLMACLDSLQPEAKSIVQAAHADWLPTDQVHRLMDACKSLGVPMIEQQPIRPKAGDLFLGDRQRRFDRGDGHDWIDRRSNKLKVDGQEVLQVVYFTTRDGKLQRRAYHFLPGCKPELARLHLLHYQLPPGLLDSERGKPGPKKRASGGQSERPSRGRPKSQPEAPITAPQQEEQRAQQAVQQAVQQQFSQSAGAVPAVLNPDLSDVARWSRAEKVWAECDQIVKVLLMDPATRLYFFGQLVEVQVTPDYCTVVKQPMDLSTVLSKLSATPREYSTPYQFRDDVRIVFNNCRRFSPPGNHVRMVGDEASARFETEWTAAQMEARWEAHLRLCEQEDQQRQAAAAEQRLKRQQQHQQHQQQAAGVRASRPAATTSAKAASAVAAEAAAAAAAAEGEAAAAATLSPQARLAQQLAGSGERMYTGSFDLPDLDGEQQAAASAPAGPQQQRAAPAVGRQQAAAPAAAAGAASKGGESWGQASESEAEELEIGGGPAAQQAQQAAAEQTAAQRQQQEAAEAELRAADRRQQEAAAAAAAEERQRQAAEDAERQQREAAKAERQQREAAEAERQQKAAEEEHRKQQAAEAERQRQQREAAKAERQRQQQQQQQAAEEERQQQESQQQQQHGQKREREEAAEGSEAPPGAKRPATAAESQGQQQQTPPGAAESQARQHTLQLAQQQAVQGEPPGVKQEPLASVKLEQGASGAVDRFAAVRVAMPILRRAGVTGATYMRFLHEFLRKNSDDAEVALAVELLQECDAAGDSDAVRTLVESYLPQ